MKSWIQFHTAICLIFLLSVMIVQSEYKFVAFNRGVLVTHGVVEVLWDRNHRQNQLSTHQAFSHGYLVVQTGVSWVHWEDCYNQAPLYLLER